MYDLIIIGGGPAGINAGIYAARKKLNSLLICRDFIGQVGKSFLIENYLGFEKIRGVELAQKFKNHLKRFKIGIKQGEEVGRIIKEKNSFKVKTNQNNYLGQTIIIATGRDPRPLEVPGEKELLGQGVSYCVTCDGPLFEGKEAAVIGGGNSGFEAALDLSKYCPKVYLLHNGPKPKADELTQERVKKEKEIELILKAETKEIKGKKLVESLIYKDLEGGKQKELKVQGVFVQIGYVPATGFVKELVDFNQWDEIIVDPKTCQTKTPGLFGAGDVTNIAIKQIITAASQGAIAALNAYEHLQKQKT